MKVANILIIQLLIFLNFIYCVKPSVQKNNEEEGSGSVIDTDLKSFDESWKRILNYEQNVFIMEEKLKSMSETFNQLELKMKSFVNENMDLLEKHIGILMEKIIDDKTARIDQIVEEKIKVISKRHSDNEKCTYHRIPKSCGDLKGCDSNTYNIMVPKATSKPFPASCDLETLGGGWIVIQRRQDGSEDFYRNWTDYVNGFGDVNGEFFIGLRQLHALTSLGEPQELYIILENFDGNRRYARYGKFRIESENTDYMLKVGQYSGDAGDSFSIHNGYKFSTRDRDNDSHLNYNCAEGWKAAWWYSRCYNSNLNGQYFRGEKIKTEGGINWYTFGGAKSSLKFVQMMIRPKID